MLATPNGRCYVVSGMVAAGAWRRHCHGRRPAADDLQRAVARPVLEWIGASFAASPSRRELLLVAALAGAAAVAAEARRHPVSGDGGVFDRRVALFPGAGARHLLEPRQPLGCGGRHADRPLAITLYFLVRENNRPLAGSRACCRRPNSGSASCRSLPACSACRPLVLVSLLTPAPSREQHEFARRLGLPEGFRRTERLKVPEPPVSGMIVGSTCHTRV